MKTMTNGRLTGMRVKLMKYDADTDDDGNERVVPVGTNGTIGQICCPKDEGYDVNWDNGSCTIYTEDELTNKSCVELIGFQYRLTIHFNSKIPFQALVGMDQEILTNIGIASGNIDFEVVEGIHDGAGFRPKLS